MGVKPIGGITKVIKRYEGESLKLNKIWRGNRLYFTVFSQKYSDPPPPAINNDWSLILSFLSSRAILFHIRRNLRSLFHFIDITVNSWFSSFQVVLLDRLCRSQVYILLITIYFYCLFFLPGTEHEIDSHGFYSESVRQLRHFFSFVWKMTWNKMKQVRCHLLDLQRLCIAFLQNYWFLSHFYPSLFDSKFLGRACVRGTQRKYSSKPLTHSVIKCILVFKR